MTINEIVLDINHILEVGEKQYNTWKLKKLVNEKIPGLFFTDSNGVYIYVSRGDNNRLPLVQFKIKRKRIKIQPARSWQNSYTEMIAANISLDTKEVGEMTVEQLVSLYKQQVQEQRNANDQKEHEDYLQIKSVLDATGMDMVQLWNVSQIVSKRHYGWDKMVERWGCESE